MTARGLDHELPDVVGQEVPTRKYPSDALAAHLVGYVGEANEAQVSEGGFSLGAIVGQTGVEKNYNAMLMGQDGARRSSSTAMGREISEIEKIKPVEGRRVQLTLDLAMQKAAEEAFRKLRLLGLGHRARSAQRRCADARQPAGLRSQCVCRGHRSRRVPGAHHRQAAAAAESRDSGTLFPGSTFKLVVATAALEEGLITPVVPRSLRRRRRRFTGATSMPSQGRSRQRRPATRD